MPALVSRSNNPTEVRGLGSIFTFQLSATEAPPTKMKLISRKVPKTLEDETVSLLPEDPEDMVSSSPCTLLRSSQTLPHVPIVSIVTPPPTIIVTPSFLISTHEILIYITTLVPHVCSLAGTLFGCDPSSPLAPLSQKTNMANSGMHTTSFCLATSSTLMPSVK